ncbi:MAG: YadA-like family protein [Aggregatibacter sp.]
MNTQLLKRTAVALFISGVVSSSAFATDPFTEALKKTNQHIDELKDAHNDLTGHVTSEISRVTEYVNNMSDDIDTNTAEIEKIKENHNGLADHVTSEISRVTEYVNNMSDDIDTNTADIEKIKENHNGLADHVTSEINRVTDYVNNMSDDIDTNTAEIEKLKNTSSFLDAAKVEKNTQDIRAQNSMIETKANKTYVDSKLADKADKAELASKADKTSVIKNETMIKANTADIAQLKSMQQKNISALKTKVDRNSARIDQLDSRVNDLDKEVKNGLASQAALSGLFQPYNVGKVNMSAAVGGYKSKTALAVGTGYRFNENIAAKAGVSFSANGGGASYNAGINFEW